MEVLRRCPLAIAQRLVHRAIALSMAVLDRVTKTMSVAPLLMNNLDNSKQKTSNLLSPAPPPYSWSLLGKSEGPAPPPSSKISWSFDLAWSPCVTPPEELPTLHGAALKLFLQTHDLLPPEILCTPTSARKDHLPLNAQPDGCASATCQILATRTTHRKSDKLLILCDLLHTEETINAHVQTHKFQNEHINLSSIPPKKQNETKTTPWRPAF